MTNSAIPALIGSSAESPALLNLEFEGRVELKRCRHSVTPAAHPAKVSDILAKAGVGGTELQYVYATCNGAKFFFSASDSTESGAFFIPPIAILEIGSILKKTRELREDLVDVPEEERPAYSGGVAFAEALRTGNLFVLMPSGPFIGKVFYCDHDPDENDWPNTPFAESVEDFLRKVLVHPYHAIADISGADRVWT